MASKSRRRRTRVRTLCGTSRSRSRSQNGRNSFRSTRSGGRSRYRRNGSFPASRMARSTSRSSETGWSSMASRRMARSVRVCDRLATNPARCAESWTLSVKTRAFFSRASSASSPNIVDSVTDSSVAIALPRNRMPSARWHDGQVSFRESSSASGPVWVSTGSIQPSRKSGSSSAGADESSIRCRTENQRSPSTGAASRSSGAAFPCSSVCSASLGA